MCLGSKSLYWKTFGVVEVGEREIVVDRDDNLE
jgi:hypothetical protein